MTHVSSQKGCTHAPTSVSRGGPWCSIVPPYLLEALAKHGTAEQRAAAITSLSVDYSLRTDRALAFATTHPAALRGARATAQPHRSVYDAGGTFTTPGALVRAEGGKAVKDADVNQAYDGLGATFAFYRDVLARNSIDDAGLPLVASVHVGQQWDNAVWDGKQMMFGDGDGEIFGHFTASLDVIGHELTHGVTQYEADLLYRNQSGALNESISDVFGVLVKQHYLNQRAEDADWLVGADLFRKGFKGKGLRSMAYPGTAYDDPRLGGKDPQPDHMDSYVHTVQDNGGVHLNSGIPNRAFYLTAVALGSYTWEVAGAIWYAALQDRYLKPTATFASFAKVTIRVAGSEFDAATASAVRKAWLQVGVRV